jgi:hypothetical protein
MRHFLFHNDGDTTASDWSSVCAGEPLVAPVFPSPGTNGPVGSDSEWTWAWPSASPSFCPSGRPSASPPVSSRRVTVQLGSGAPFAQLPRAAEGAATSDHAYAYSIVGTGEPARFLLTTTHPSDRPNYYGELRITLTPQ